MSVIAKEIVYAACKCQNLIFCAKLSKMFPNRRKMCAKCSSYNNDPSRSHATLIVNSRYWVVEHSNQPETTCGVLWLGEELSDGLQEGHIIESESIG